MQVRNRLLLPILWMLFLAFASPALATHLRGGEITYRTDAVNPLKVYVEVTLYQNTHSPIREDRIELDMGDGNKVSVNALPELDEPLEAHSHKRTWRAEHTYANSGAYRISYTGINRNEGIVNMTSSVSQTFFVPTWANLSPQVGGHTSPRLLAPPIMRAILGRPFHHNLTAYDPDGDSLAFELAVPLTSTLPPGGSEPSAASGYRLPEGLVLHPQTGQIAWASAGMVGGQATTGEFALAVRVTKFRGGQVLSRLVRDFQIIVVPSSFQPPALSISNREALRISPENTVEAPLQQLLEIRLNVSRQGADSVRLLAISELFLEASSRPSFTATQEQESVRGVFLFSPPPSHLRSLPYLVTYRAVYFYGDHPNQPVQQDLTVVLYVTRQTITGLSAQPPSPQQAHLYPSPVRDEFVVEVPDTRERQLVLYSLDGKEVLRQAISFPQTRIRRPSHLKSGLYRYTLSGPGNGAQAGKVVLQ